MSFKDPMVYHSKLYFRPGPYVTFDTIFFNVSEKFKSKDETPLASYIEDAHYRWNLFARGLYGDLARHSFIAFIPEDANITREEAERRREEGLNSDLYKVARQRMESLAHISIFERMDESMELLCWTFCWNEDEIPYKYKQSTGLQNREELSPEEREAFEKYHNIDLQLYQDALELFDKRYEEMKAQKAQGIICNLRRSCPVQMNVISNNDQNQMKNDNDSECNIVNVIQEENIREELPLNKVWQIAVPHTGTTTLENVFKAATEQKYLARFKNNKNICISCDKSIFENYLAIDSTSNSGMHADYFRAQTAFVNVNSVS